MPENTASVKLVVTPTVYDINGFAFNKMIAEPSVFTEFGSASGYLYTNYYGVAMYALDLPIDAHLEFFDAKGNKIAYTADITSRPDVLLKELYQSNLPKTSDKTAAKTRKANTRAAARDLLILGGEAQRYFQANGAPAESDLGKITVYVDAADPTYSYPVATDAETVITGLNDVNDKQQGANYNSACNYTSSVTLVAAPSFAYQLTISNKNGTIYDLDKLSIDISYVTSNNTASGGEETIRETYTGSELTTTVGGKNTYAYCYFNSMALYDSYKTITAVVTYNGDVIMTDTYSLETYCGSMLDDAKNGAMCTALAKFGISIRAMFGYN
ncbi:MAG: hypothetical protein MJ090_03235 [Clostridia bacterium]|nr:hypothetical protein [Clostridia bacterium]